MNVQAIINPNPLIRGRWRILRPAAITLLLLVSVGASGRALGAPAHIVVVIMENHSASQIIGNASAPYINNVLVANGALLTNSHAVEHPSQPNYLDLFSGSNQGVINDATPVTLPFSTPNLGAKLLANGLTFTTFSESLPSVGFTGDNATTVPGQNQYQRKHNPAVNWQANDAPDNNHLSPTLNQPFSAFPTTDAGFVALPTVSLVVPNEQNDMHDGSIAAGDTWLSQNMEAFRTWASTHNSVLIVTWDEDSNNTATNQIATIFNGQNIRSGLYSEASVERAAGLGVDHFNILRTIEDIYGLGTCNAVNDGMRLPIIDLFIASVQNISTRVRVLLDDNVLIGGFIVSGNAPKKVFLRAVGPSLTAFGVPGALQDPTLDLEDGNNAPIESNDDWQSAPEPERTEIANSALKPNDVRESAIVRTLTPGRYTAIIRGKGRTTGVALVEAYDIDSTADSQFGNISTRGVVGTVDDVMIAGFIAANGNAKVLVRALGPSLSAFGVTGALQDPTLDLKDSNGTVVLSNDNWRSGSTAGDIPPGFTPADERESALVKTLAPGRYTAIVSGVGSATGVGLVEVYNLR